MMRIVIGAGNNRQEVVVEQGRGYRQQPHHERQRFQRQFCQIAGIKR